VIQISYSLLRFQTKQLKFEGRCVIRQKSSFLIPVKIRGVVEKMSQGKLQIFTMIERVVYTFDGRAAARSDEAKVQ